MVSAARPSQFPDPDRPEVAFAGRSNVGKSSLLNRVLNRKKLARTSRTPGRTQLINFFNINNDIYFVDLPGFGFAKVPLHVKESWRPMVGGYLTAGRDLRLVLVLMDIRREPRQEETDLLAWLAALGLRFQVVVTKTDKLSKSQRASRSDAIARSLSLPSLPIQFSAISGAGREEIWRILTEACFGDDVAGAETDGLHIK